MSVCGARPTHALSSVARGHGRGDCESPASQTYIESTPLENDTPGGRGRVNIPAPCAADIYLKLGGHL